MTASCQRFFLLRSARARDRRDAPADRAADAAFCLIQQQVPRGVQQPIEHIAAETPHVQRRIARVAKARVGAVHVAVSRIEEPVERQCEARLDLGGTEVLWWWWRFGPCRDRLRALV